MVPVFVIRIVSVGIVKMAFANTTLKTGDRCSSTGGGNAQRDLHRNSCHDCPSLDQQSDDTYCSFSHDIAQSCPGGDYPGKVRTWWPKRGYFQQDLIQLSLSKHGVDPAIGAQLNYQLFYLTGVNNVPKNIVIWFPVSLVLKFSCIVSPARNSPHQSRAAVKRNANHSLSVTPTKPFIEYFPECLMTHQEANTVSTRSGFLFIYKWTSHIPTHQLFIKIR